MEAHAGLPCVRFSLHSRRSGQRNERKPRGPGLSQHCLPWGLLPVLPVSLVEMVTSVAFDPSVWHPALAVTLSHIFAFLPRVTMLGVVPVPVARRIDVAFTYRRIFA